MGGIGSGRRAGFGGKKETNDAMPLDIRRLNRERLLWPGNSFSWQWLTNGRPVAGLSIRVELQALVVSYLKRSSGEIVEQRIIMQSTPCRFGGQRHWFACPRCGRRAAVLYVPGRYYECRCCAGVAYPTQKERAGDRASTQANKIRKRLGWPVGILNNQGDKPKGMHWRTFSKLKREHDALVQISFHEIGRKLGFLHRLVER
jgi:hypothetical protein